MDGVSHLRHGHVVAGRKEDYDFGANVLLTADFKFAAMKFDERLCDRETETSAFTPARAGTVDLAERLLSYLQFVSSHAAAGIAYKDGNGIAGKSGCFNIHAAADGREIDRIGEDVGEDLREFAFVPADRRKVVGKPIDNFNLCLLRFGFECAKLLSDNGLYADLSSIERVAAALDAGNVEDIVYDGQKMNRGIVDQVGVFDDFASVDFAAILLGDNLGEANDCVEGGPEFMAHIRDEFGLHLAGQLGLNACRMLSASCAVTQDCIAK